MINWSGQILAQHQMIRKTPVNIYSLACFSLATLAFMFNYATGHRGVFLLDQSMIFDGGWRILQGQIPYKDFLIPFGPVTFYIQALFFWLFGVNWTATVLPACLMSFAATLIAIRIVRLLVDGSRLLALGAGAATAICFNAPFGTLWLEQTTMFFDLLALLAVVESLRAPARQKSFWRAGSGLLLAVAMLTKQNYGVLFAPVVFAVAAAGELPDIRQACRSVMVTAAGIIVGLAAFLVWAGVASDLASFFQRTVVVAGEIGRSRMTPAAIIQAVTFNATPKLFQIDLIGFFSGCVALFLGICNYLGGDSEATIWRETAPAALIAIAVSWFRSLTQVTTLNEWQNSLAFMGLAGCLGIGLCFRIISYLSVVPARERSLPLRLPSARSVQIVLCVVAGMWGMLLLGYEAQVAWSRKIQHFPAGARFQEAVRVRGMERVLWGEPTTIRMTTPLNRTDFEGLVTYLSANGSPFFVMGDSTILYGLLGIPSPQPLLYFLPSHSFLKEEIAELDELVAASLERNKVAIIVREKVTHLTQVRDAYPQFPRTWQWFTANFDHMKDYGIYEVWARRSPGR